MAVTMNKDNVRSLIGGELGVSEWIRIEQARVNAFADTTEDHQFIHVDPERAAATPFGGTIAHGFLTLSLLPRMMEDIGGGMADAVMGLNYGFDKIRFLAPVKVNSRVRARAKLLDVQEKVPNQFLIKQEITVEIENETKPALVAEWLTMVMVRP
ncbi:MAG: MaoC family dehydratase [Gammaproteobacteria bacterium]|jgi:acyl dehydratase|nr:MaoC family dehydratase [Gammaproteobacteria bacterium]MBK9470322.1 MaoC family dehydratase [Gammaproteobacteria bacterium]